MNAWPDFLGKVIVIDVETSFASDYNLKKQNTVEYIRDSRFFVQAMAWSTPHNGRSGVLFHDEDIQLFFDHLATEDYTLVCHNAHFDGKLIAEHYGVRFKHYVCTLAMARALLCNYCPGYSLDAIYHYLFQQHVKDDTLDLLKGHREVPRELRKQVGLYVMRDVLATVDVFESLSERMPDKQWWHMDWTLRQFINPAFEIDTGEVDQFIAEYEADDVKLYGQYGKTKKDFASSAKFAALLREHGEMYDVLTGENSEHQHLPSVPIVAGAGGKLRYDFSSKSERFIRDVLESANPEIRQLGQLRLRAASSSELAQAHALKSIAQITGSPFPLGVNYSGCVTHRLSGSSGVCGVNVLAFKRGSRMRNALRAPGGYRVLSFDMSAFELGICRFLSQDKPSMRVLVSKEGDLYLDFAKLVFRNDALTKHADGAKRDVGKTSELQLQYNSGAKTLRKQLIARGAEISAPQARDITNTFRHTAHPALYAYWQQFGHYIGLMARSAQPVEVKHAPFLQIEPGGIRLPSNMLLTFPNLKKVSGEWTYQKTVGNKLIRDKLYGGKAMQYCCQALANVIIQEKKREIARHCNVRIAHEVYDDVTMIVARDFKEREIDEVMALAVESVPWWPALPLSLEWGIGESWGGCDKSNRVYGEQFE